MRSTARTAASKQLAAQGFGFDALDCQIALGCQIGLGWQISATARRQAEPMRAIA